MKLKVLNIVWAVIFTAFLIALTVETAHIA